MDGMFFVRVCFVTKKQSFCYDTVMKCEERGKRVYEGGRICMYVCMCGRKKNKIVGNEKKGGKKGQGSQGRDLSFISKCGEWLYPFISLNR